MRELHLFAVRKNSAELAAFQRAITGTTLDRKGFQSYWLNHHADHGRRTLIPPNTYSQIHAIDPAAAVAALAAATGMSIDTHDGVAECYFPSIDAFKAQMARADVAVDALEDEKNFIDHSKSTFGLFDVSM